MLRACTDFANKQAKPVCRTCASRAKLKMRTVHANTDPIHNLARRLVPEIGFCTARARPTSQPGLLVSKSVRAARRSFASSIARPASPRFSERCEISNSVRASNLA